MRSSPKCPLVGINDGMNEKRLAAHLLYLDGSKYPSGDGKKPVLSNMAWAQYVLDNYGTVKEALEGLDKVEIISRQAIVGRSPLGGAEFRIVFPRPGTPARKVGAPCRKKAPPLARKAL